MSGQRTGMGRYWVIIIGLVAVLCGVTTLGGFLAAAGEHLNAEAIALGSASAGCFGVGLLLLMRSVQRRGGLLDAQPTAAERVTYSREHPTRFHPAKRGVPPERAQPGKRDHREVSGREHSDHQG